MVSLHRDTFYLKCRSFVYELSQKSSAVEVELEIWGDGTERAKSLRPNRFFFFFFLNIYIYIDFSIKAENITGKGLFGSQKLLDNWLSKDR